MTVGQHFVARFLSAAIFTGVVAYWIAAFTAYDRNPAHWPEDLRSTVAISWLVFGGIASLCAGVSAVKN